MITKGLLMGLEEYISKIDRHQRIAYVNINLLGQVSSVQVELELLVKTNKKSITLLCLFCL